METHALGLDISTSCTGICILDRELKIKELIALDFKNKNKYPNLFSKAAKVESTLTELGSRFKIESVAIESALHMFRPGASSANTISMLMKFNGIVSWLAFKTLNIEPEFISASTARKQCGIKIKKGKKAKLTVLEHLMENEAQFVPFVKYTRTGSISPNTYDMSDAFVIAKASLIK